MKGDQVIRTKARLEAADWLAALQSGESGDTRRAEFEAWLAESRDHQHAFIELSELWSDFADPRLKRELLSEEAAQSDGGIAAAVTGRVAGVWRTCRQVAALPRLAIGATALAIVAVTALIVTMQSSNEFIAEYSSDVGARDTARLPDGSVIRLNTATRMGVRYTPDARMIDFESGEAIFEVARDPARPFKVNAGDGSITAVGTAFAVKRIDQDTEVIVYEGHVLVDAKALRTRSASQVDPAIAVPTLSLETADRRTPAESGRVAKIGESAKNLVMLHAGQAARYDETIITEVEDISRTAIEKKLAWREGVIVFDDQALHEVIREVSRYTTHEIVVTDAEIANVRIGGYFPLDNVETIFALLEEGFPLKVINTAPNRYEIRSANTAD